MNKPKVAIDTDEEKAAKKASAQAGDAGASPDAADAPKQKAHPVEAVQGWIHATFPGHENAVLCGFAGFLAALLLFIIGFWETLLLVLCITVGVALGQQLDGDPKIIAFFRSLLGSKDDRS